MEGLTSGFVIKKKNKGNCGKIMNAALKTDVEYLLLTDAQFVEAASIAHVPFTYFNSFTYFNFN